MKAAALAATLALLVAPAYAQHSGNEMLPICGLVVAGGSYSDVGAYMDAGRCLGSLQALRRLGPVLVDGAFCVPPDVTLKQLARTAVVGMNRRPDMLHLDFAYLAAFVFADIWPCAPAKKTK